MITRAKAAPAQSRSTDLSGQTSNAGTTLVKSCRHLQAGGHSKKAAWFPHGLEKLVKHRRRDASKSWTYDEEDRLSDARDALASLASAYTRAMNQSSGETLRKLQGDRLAVMRELQRLHVHNHEEIALILKEFPRRIEEIRRIDLGGNG
ncbi:hypothetical protein [Streptomyces auratus]|uniref:Uncharacterized protein n=1 Tax=Streptomyces auratus AGR0001 TaxID=1160718 RepID=A0A8B1NDS6_9ACTN|nr:hypothetical protein [Streptomyces auratus]QTZ92838.1 hypothetical protein SU9_016260 [Streptomyces auratus AGR0001]